MPLRIHQRGGRDATDGSCSSVRRLHEKARIPPETLHMAVLPRAGSAIAVGISTFGAASPKAQNDVVYSAPFLRFTVTMCHRSKLQIRQRHCPVVLPIAGKPNETRSTR